MYEGLPDRIQRALGDDGPAIDLDDPLQVDRAACALLQRFLDRGDADAFHLLIELTEPVILKAADGVADDVGLMMPSDELAVAFFSELFTLVGRNARDWQRFVARATTWMHEQAEAWIRDIALMEPPSHNDRTLQEARPDGSTRSRRIRGREDVFKHIVSIAFHRLETPTRRILRATDVHGMSHEQIATMLGVPVTEVPVRIREARGRLDDGVSRLSEGEDP